MKTGIWWTADVYDEENNLLDSFKARKKKTLFTICKMYYSHCLGRIEDDAGNFLGWRFAKCGSGEKCIPTVFNIKVYKE